MAMINILDVSFLLCCFPIHIDISISDIHILYLNQTVLKYLKKRMNTF